jgi:two-component system sensor histidine kinase MprB
MSYRVRLMAITSLTVAAVSVVSVLAVYFFTQGTLQGEVDRALERRAGDVRGFFSQHPDQQDDEQPRLPAPERSQVGDSVQIITASGDVRTAAAADLAFKPSKAERRVAERGGELLATRTADGTRLRTYTRAIGNGIGVQVSRPTNELEGSLARLRWYLAMVCAAATLLALLLSLGVSSAMIAPLRAMVARLRQMRDHGQLEASFAEGSDEVGEIGREFNALFAAVSESAERQRRFVSDASHELRTPLTSLRLNVDALANWEAMSDEQRSALRSDMTEQLDEITQLVADLADLARHDEIEQASEFDLAQVVTDAVEQCRRQLGCEIELVAKPGTLVHGPVGLMQRAVSNMVRNACIHGSEPVTVTSNERGVEVADRGPGFDEADLAHVFERFYRSPASRQLPGTGLGLSMVEQAARLSGASVRAENRVGGGAVVAIDLKS